MLKDIPSAPVVPSVLIEESEGNFVPLECLSSGSASLVVELFCNDEREVLITEKNLKNTKKYKNSENPPKKIKNCKNKQKNKNSENTKKIKKSKNNKKI